MARHALKKRWSFARRCWLFFGICAAPSILLERAPRYEKAVDLFFACAVIVAAACNRAVAIKVIGGLVAVQSVLAGVVATVSLNEAFDLVAGLIVVGAIGFVLWLSNQRPAAPARYAELRGGTRWPLQKRPLTREVVEYLIELSQRRRGSSPGRRMTSAAVGDRTVPRTAPTNHQLLCAQSLDANRSASGPSKSPPH